MYIPHVAVDLQWTQRQTYRPARTAEVYFVVYSITDEKSKHIKMKKKNSDGFK